MNRICVFAGCIVLILAALVSRSLAEDKNLHIFKAMGAPAHPRVQVAWNRYHDSEGLADIFKRLQNAYPRLARLYSIGQSYEERPLWCLEITNREKGDPARKPGMFIDGNIHGNEVQTGEVVAYTAWYLCESFDSNERVRFLLDHFVFYLVPTTNPDGRDFWFYDPNTANSSRSGKKPLDNDRDGLVDEDGFDDLNGDGAINLMRIQDPNGRWKKHPDYPDILMVRAKDDERGEYSLLGYEGIDNDGDGEINEDGPGGYDPNRNWGFDWQPGYVQYGALEFPFSLPNTQAVAQFVIAHPNIVSMQCYHNNGGMILREPGREGGEMQDSDARLMQSIASKGEAMIPFYRSMVIYRDLYTVWGGETGWFYGARGIYGYVNELWSDQNLFRSDKTGDEAEAEFDKYLLLNDALVKWEEYDHPTYGKIEIGGWRKEYGRVPPSFLLEEECHRNMAFSLYHAAQMPRIEFGEVTVESLRNGSFKIWVEARNHGMIPTRSAQDIRHHILPPDTISLQGKGVTVQNSGRVTDRYFKKVEPVKIRPERVEVEAIPGLDSVWVQFVVSGKGEAVVTLDTARGGAIEKTVRLE